MSRADVLKQIKVSSLSRAYQLFKEAERNGTLKRVPLTEEQRAILRPSTGE